MRKPQGDLTLQGIMRLSPCPLGTVSNGSSEQLWHLKEDEKISHQSTVP